MELAAAIVGIVSVAVSAFSYGYVLSEYHHSQYIIQERVEKRLKSALDERCAFCQWKNDAMESTNEANEINSASLDI